MSNGVFYFNFLTLLLSEILGGPNFTLGVPTPYGYKNFSARGRPGGVWPPSVNLGPP